MENPNNFLVNTDYPFDMIVYFKECELTSTGSTAQTVTIPHSLGFVPLLFGVWSSSQDYSEVYPLVDDGYFNGIYVESDENNIYVQQRPMSSSSAGHKYYLKIYGFAPISWTGDCEPTAQTSSQLLLDTDTGYSPLLAAGEIQPRRMDVQPEVPTPEQTGIAQTIGLNGFVEITGRCQTASLYYREPIEPQIMIWQTVSSTNRTSLAAKTFFSATGYALRNAPYADFVANTGSPGTGAIAITNGVTRTGMANYNDITHFRVYA